MKELALSKRFFVGEFALLDDQDYERQKDYSWHIVSNRVARIVSVRVNRCTKNTRFYLWRELLGVDDPKVRVRYVDGNPMNHQRANLEIIKPEFAWGKAVKLKRSKEIKQAATRHIVKLFNKSN